MKQTKKLLSFLTLIAALLAPGISQATIFDAPDILAPKNSSLSGVGEILLSDPTSDGFEVHGRHGLNEDWNLGAVIGGGTKDKRFRLGGEAVYIIFPDTRGQFGFSIISSAMLLQRTSSTGLQLRMGPMGHKKFTAFNGLPGLVYAALPFYFEARSGHYTTGTHIVVGSLIDLTHDHRFYAGGEVGIRISKYESYLLAGVGFRFGELKIEVEEKEKPAKNHPKSSEEPEEREYRSEDFQK